ncbi:MAG: SusC/RagA family TonB-linked outer membrane protein [Prolixibacteraceae bacterium]|nr:SusC/RagA family TonB-linked outer membrane protein [Prolixibacteraceae bacterium]
MKKTILLTVTLLCLLAGFNEAFAQSAIIRGKITDEETGETIPQVNVVEMDKNGRNVSGTVTDINGNYILEITDVNNDIQVSFIGYIKQTFKVNNRSMIDIELESESIGLEDVVVTGQKIGNDGFIPVRDRATAVTRMELKGMESVMGTTVEDMLQGRLGNVDITAVSGDPGAGLNIRIRGTASLNANNNPLIVVNGIPYNATFDQDFDFGSADIEQFGQLIDVAPEDIETIEVLKDAASTAIWGSRAANGVLMIKTKRGIKSKPVFDYTYKFTVSKEPDPIPMLDGAGYARLITEAHYNVDYNAWTSDEIAFNPDWVEYYNYSQNTNWIKEITQIATTHDHNFSVRGGGDKSKYNMSMSMVDEGGTTIGNDLKRLTLRSSLDYDLSTKIRFNSDIMFTRYDQTNNFNGNIRGLAYTKMPNLSVYDRDTNNVHVGEYFIPKNTLQGNATQSPNPVASANLASRKTYRDNSRALFTLNWNMTPKLTYTSTVTLDISDQKTTGFVPYKAVGYTYDDNSTNQSSNNFSKSSNLYTVNKAVYRPDLGADNELMVMGQFDTQSQNSRSYTVNTSRSASRFIDEPINDKHLNSFNSGFSEFRSMGFYLTANYKYKDKYSIMFGAKTEGNSNYSKNSRWGIFPTISTFWRISSEPFLSSAQWMDDVKVRFSWGQSGNGIGGYYTTYSAGSQYSYMDMQGVQPDNFELTSLKWETIEQINPGLSVLALDNKLNVEVDYYIKKTFDMNMPNSPIPSSTGFSSFKENNGEMENRGFEFSADYTVINNREKDFSLSFNFNLSSNKNMVIRLPENYTMEYGDMLSNGNYKISVVPGEPLGGFFGYEYLGVFEYDDDAIVRDKNGNPVYGIGDENPMYMIMGGAEGYVFEGGDAIYKDQNYDGKIDELDLIYLGDLNPKLMGGANFRVSWKGLVLTTFFNFKAGQKVINQTRMDTEKMYNYDNQSLATNWRWRRAGDVTDVPRALYNEGYNWLGSDRFVESGDFLRLRSISLTYRFSRKVCDWLHLKEARIYGTGYNIYTLTKYSGQDPDVGIPSSPSSLPKDSSKTPPSRRYTFGLNITF